MFKKLFILFTFIISIQINALEFNSTALNPIKKLFSRRDVQAVTATAALAYAGWRAWQSYKQFSCQQQIQRIIQDHKLKKEEFIARFVLNTRPKEMLTIQESKEEYEQKVLNESFQESRRLTQAVYTAKALEIISQEEKRQEENQQRQLPAQPQVLEVPQIIIEVQGQQALQADPLIDGCAQAQEQKERKEQEEEKKQSEEAGFDLVNRDEAVISLSNINYLDQAFLILQNLNNKDANKLFVKRQAFNLLYKCIFGNEPNFAIIDFGPLSFEQLLLENFNALKLLCEQNIQNVNGDNMELAQKKLLQYNKVFNELKALYYNSPWSHGKIIIKAILENDQAKIDQARKEYDKSRIYVIWYLYQLAVEKNQAFTEGTFAIVDCKKIFDFIFEKNYHRISSHYNKDNKSKHAIGADISDINLSDYLYNRIAGFCGWDLPNDLAKEYTFPNNKFHIFGNVILLDKKLFGDTANIVDYHFIKAEKFGTADVVNGAGHAVEYFHSLLNKANAGADDAPNMRKERVEAKVLKAWKNLLDSMALAQARKDEFYKMAKDFGIKAIIAILSKNTCFEEKMLNLYQKQLLNELKAIINSYDNPEIRTGREVILTLQGIKHHLKNSI